MSGPTREGDRLRLARRLLAAGVPVVATDPDDRPRQAWREITTAEQCDLSLYRSGDGLLMLCGHGIDAVDEDTKAGGSVDHLPPFRSYGVTRTPSGGRHLIVPSSGLGKISPLTTAAGHVGDYAGGRPDHTGRLGVFIPGTKRAKYPGGEYVEEVEWDVEGCLAARADADLVAALAGCARPREPREVYRNDSPQRDPALGLHPLAAEAIDAALARLDALAAPWSPGDRWDDTTFEVACELVRHANSGWTGYTLDDAEADLLDHAPADEAWGRREHDAKWASALKAVGGASTRPRLTAAEEFAAAPGETPAGGWAPVDLAATVAGLLAGTLSRPEPTVGDFGGGCLFYPGRVNSVHGDSSAGKTWTALVAARQELAGGETVVYVDLEDSAEGVVSRLLADLGVPAAAVRERFVYLRPDERLGRPEAAALDALLAARRPSLVVVDSTGEALALEGANPNADEEVARWFRLLPRLAARHGAAVLLLDHATKAGDNDLWPIGSQRKRAAVTGAAYLQKVAVPFGRGKDGKAVLRCAKDRHGNYPLGQRVAALVVAGGAIDLADETGGAGADFRPTGYMEKVSRLLEAATEPLSIRRVTDAVTGKKAHVTAALDQLVSDGFATREAGPRGSHQHASARPYREADDQQGPLL